MEIAKSIRIEVLTPEEHNKQANEYYAAGDIDGFLEFQETHNILYADPIPEQDKEILKNLEIPDIPDDIEPILI